MKCGLLTLIGATYDFSGKTNVIAKYKKATTKLPEASKAFRLILLTAHPIEENGARPR